MFRPFAAAFSKVKNNNYMNKAIYMISAGIILLLASASCVNEEYEVSEDKMNLEVTVFQEGVSIPLGSTAAIKAKDLEDRLDEEYREYLKAREDGVYSVYLADSFDLSDSLGFLKDMVKIDDISFSQDVSFSLSDVDVSDVKIDAFDYAYEEDFGDDFKSPQIPTIKVEESYSYAAGMNGFALSAEDKKVKVDPVENEDYIISLPEDFVVPEELISDTELSVQDLVDLTGVEASVADAFGPEFVDVNFQMTFPKGIRSIEEVVMNEGARIGVTVEMTNSLFTSGTINPYIDFDVSSIFHLTDDSSSEAVDTDHILADFEMPASGGKIYEEYGVESIVFNAEDWRYDEEGRLVLDKTIQMEINGHPIYNDVKTSTRHIAACGYRKTPVNLTVEFVDFEVDYVKATLDPVTVEKHETVALDMQSIELPQGIAKVDHVDFTDDSQIGFSLSVENRIEGLGITLEYLEISLPEGMEVEGAVNGKLTYENLDVSNGYTGSIKVDRFNLPAPVDGSILLSDMIEVKARAVAEGSISTDAIPATEAEDLKLNIAIDGRLEVADYQAEIEEYEYPVSVLEHIEEEVPAALADMGEVVIYPEGDPVIEIDVTIPEAAIPIGPVGKGVVISFPEMLKLKDIPSEYDYDIATNTITFKDVLPSRIVLPIDRLVLAPVLEGDKCYVRGDITVDGTVGVSACQVRKADVEGLASADLKVALKVHVPELVPSRFSLGQYTSNISQKVEMTLFEPDQLPKEVVSVEMIHLKDVYADICLDASKLPSTGGAALTLDLAVDLPDLLVLEDGLRDESGLLHIKGSLDKDGKIKPDPIKINALDLSGVDLKSEEALAETITVDGTVKLADAELNVDEWMGKEHSVKFEASISNIDIAKFTGKVNYAIDPVDESVDMTSVSKAINTENIQTVIDLTHVHLAVDLETNLQVAAKANAEIIPYRRGAAMESVKVALDVEAASSLDSPKKTRYWLGESSECCPEGYEFREIPILELLRDIPDSLAVKVEAGTDPDVECILEPDADYVLKVDYALDIPLQLGKDFRFEFRDTLANIPPVVSTIFRGGDLVLTGDVESSLPFELDVKANLLDADGNVIGLSEGSACQIIKGCALDGSPVKSEICLAMIKKDGAEIPDIASVELHFVAVSSGAGAPLTEESFIKATLQALVPEGINVDLREFMNEEEQ